MIKTVSIIGMGALGLLYADQITTGLGQPEAAVFVMDDERAARHKNDRYTINGEEKHFAIVPASEAKATDLVIVAVKYMALESALDVMKNCVGPETIIISVMNGVTSEKLIGARYGMEHMLLCVAQGMDAMRDGTDLKYTQCGKLHIGAADKGDTAENERLDALVEFFERAKVPYFKEDDILYRLWFKFMLNVGINQVCLANTATYGICTREDTPEHEQLMGAMSEAVKAAAANGVNLTEADMLKAVEIEKTLDPDGYPSMAQDGRAHRKSELDMFAGEIIRIAEANGFDAPYNRELYRIITQMESEY